MNHIHKTLAAIAVLCAAVTCGCSNDTKTGEKLEPDKPTASQREHGQREGQGEHDRDRGGNEEGEESGTELKLTDRYDDVRNGARLILAYDPTGNSFKGTVENTTKKTLERVRVEVHLSNGRELGPTTPGDLKPGEKRDVTLTAESKDFDGWSPHPEVGNEEEGHSNENGEGRGDHASRERSERERGEHGGEGRGEHR